MSGGEEMHSFVWSEVDCELVETVDFSNGKAAVYSKRCPTRQTSPNEDAACLIEVGEGRGIMAVADGVGGEAAGNEAAKCIVECLIEACFEVDFDETLMSRGLRNEIMDAIEFANATILNWGLDSGTTLTAIELGESQFRCFHIGDSGALLTTNRGAIKWSTVGHAPVAQAVDIGVLDAKEALVHDEQHFISNYLGMRDVKIEVGVFQPIALRDTLLIASDGLWDNVTKGEIADFMRIGDLEKQTELLVQAASQRMLDSEGKSDDLSVICWRPFT